MFNNKTARVLSVLLVAATLLSSLALSVGASVVKVQNSFADTANILSEALENAVKTANETLEKDYGASLVVCTVDTTGETPIADYARSVFTESKLGESVLIVIAVEDRDFFFLQSSGIEPYLSNEDLASVAGEYLEDDFSSGNIDAGMMKVVSKLSGTMTNRLPKAKVDDEAQPAQKTKAGSVIVGIFKVILFIVLFGAAAFIILFVIAMFNDDAAAFLQKYVFRRNQRRPTMPQYEYDERLYGQNRRRPNPNNPYTGGQPARRPSQNHGYDDYGDYGTYGDSYNSRPQSRGNDPYGSNGTTRR